MDRGPHYRTFQNPDMTYKPIDAVIIHLHAGSGAFQIGKSIIGKTE